jgi:hypothetical protein
MGCMPCSGNDHFDAALPGSRRPSGCALRAAMGGCNGYFKRHAEFLQDTRCSLHHLQIRITPHNNANLWFYFCAQFPSLFDFKMS